MAQYERDIIERQDATIDALRADLARHQRALAAGPAHLRAQVHVEPNTRDAYARAVEAAQRRAMEEDKP